MRRTYILVRRGSNAANQPYCLRTVLGTVEARSRAEAIEIAPALLAATVYNNQVLAAVPYTRARRADQDAALEADAEASQLESNVGCCLCGRRAAAPLTRREADFWRCSRCQGGRPA